MKAAIIVPIWDLPPSGSRKTMHLISKVLRDNGVEAETVGRAYEHEEVGDTVIPPLEFACDHDTALILPEGYWRIDYFQPFVDDFPHGPVVVYSQSCDSMDVRREYETHWWGLGPTHRMVAAEKMGVEVEQIEEIPPPVDAEFWTSGPKWQGSVAFSPAKNPNVLDRVARRATKGPVFRIQGATRDQVHQMLSLADIFVQASDEEGVSSLMCEAMAMECAVVTWPSVCLPDILEHETNSLLVKQNDIIGMEECVKSLTSDPEKSRRLGNKARSRVQELFSYDRFAESVMAAWEKVRKYNPK